MSSSTLIRQIVMGINDNFIKNKNIDYFRGVIDAFSKNEYMSMLEEFKNSKRERLSSYHTLNTNGYSKYQLYSNNNYEINIIEWNKGARSLVHNHPHNGCVIKLIKGSLLEDRYNYPMNSKKTPIVHTQRNMIVPIHSFNKSQTHSYYMDGLHSVTNINNDKSYSLHFYSPPNFVPETYEHPQRLLVGK